MCGEKKRTLTDKELAEGSPPHVRGKASENSQWP